MLQAFALDVAKRVCMQRGWDLTKLEEVVFNHF